MTSSRRAARRQAVFVLYQQDVTGLSLTDLWGNLERELGGAPDPYTREVVAGVSDRLEAIDQAIDTAASGWSVDRVAPLERNIMRVAVYELRSRDDIPAAVAIDEAVGLAKRYCQAEAGGFVNGILGAIARSEVRG